MHRERVLKALAQLLVGVENKLHLADRRRRREDKLIERARLLEMQRAQNKTNLKDADANGKISYRIGAYMQMKKLEEVYTNRELSWLQFNERVLNEAGNPRVPLAERLTFASIYQTNLDEFFMVRVGSLMMQMNSKEKIFENKTKMSSEEQVSAILDRVCELEKKKARIYEQLMGELEPKGVRIINFNKLSKDEGDLLEAYFDAHIAPFLSPMIIGKQQPFPFLANKQLYAVVLLTTQKGKKKTGIVPCSNSVFKRLIEIHTRPGTFMMSEELILHFVSKLYPKYVIREKSIMRVTRNADIDAQSMYDEDMDYRNMMEELIKRRVRLDPVRVELSRKINRKAIDELSSFLEIGKKHFISVKTPLDMSFVFQLQHYLRDKQELFFEKRTPRDTPELSLKESILGQVEKKDVLLSYPFESMKPFIKMLNDAAEDPDVVSIKMTLYRVADKSQIIDALIEAAENGKEVIVLVELRARFDEANNIEMSHRLEDAGCQILYGLGDYKVHSKLCLITKKKIVDMIDEQIANKNAGKPAYIGVKINSLTDKVLIDKLIDASQAGVKVELIVRGICCVKPQVEGATENITVISVVGRYLEHSRIYRFGVGDDEKIYIASADFMTRNTVRRVEVATPVYDAHAKDKIRHIFDTIMTDDEKGKELCADGEYVDRKINSTPIDSQEQFFEEAYKNADKSADNQ